MSVLPVEQAPARAAPWREPAVRAIVYQVVIVAGVVLAGYSLFRHTRAKLAELGVHSGFAFLHDRAGFAIGEVLPIPKLEAGFVYFLGAVLTGVLSVHLLSRWAAARGRTIGTDGRLVAAAFGLCVGLPALVLYVTGHTIRTETYTADSTYRVALLTGILNTIRVCALGLLFSTIVGMVVALMRLSPNWLVSKLAHAYVEIVRNLPLLLHLFFWYFAVIRSLPGVRQSLNLGGTVFVNNRGVYLPALVPGPGFAPVLLALGLALILIFFLARYARQRSEATGGGTPVLLYAIAVLVALPGSVSWLAGAPVTATYPVLQGFNFRDAWVLTPEFATLLVGLTVYHGAYHAEIFRAGIQSVPRGQTEAALALGLGRRTLMRWVIMPQAIRAIIPPLISRYLGLIKSSSLAVAIGYPDLVAVGHSVSFATSQAIEIAGLTMAFYLSVGLVISLGMNWYNAKARLVTES